MVPVYDTEAPARDRRPTLPGQSSAGRALREGFIRVAEEQSVRQAVGGQGEVHRDLASYAAHADTVAADVNRVSSCVGVSPNCVASVCTMVPVRTKSFA